MATKRKKKTPAKTDETWVDPPTDAEEIPDTEVSTTTETAGSGATENPVNVPGKLRKTL